MDDFFKREVVWYFKRDSTEQQVLVQNLQGIRLRLMSQDIIGKFLEESPFTYQNSIKYVHLQGIQITVKARIKEGINSLNILSICGQCLKIFKTTT